MFRRIWVLLMGGLLFLALTPTASADVGPKPTMTFEFVFEGEPIAILDGQLIECEEATYTSADGLAADDVKAITVDDNGHIWFGTTSGRSEFIPPAADATATPLNEPDFITYTTADGLPRDKIRDIAFDANGWVWVGAYKSEAGVFDGQSWISYTGCLGYCDWGR